MKSNDLATKSSARTGEGPKVLSVRTSVKAAASTAAPVKSPKIVIGS